MNKFTSFSNSTMAAIGKVRIDLGGVNANNLGTFQKINQVSLQPQYPLDFYKLDTPPGVIFRLAYFNEIPVGAIKARPIYQNDNDKLPLSIYIDSIAVLKPYRSFGIGTQLLQYVEQETAKRYIHDITIHVQKSNSKLIDWYVKNGFEVTGELLGYYKEHKLDDVDAVSMGKKI